MVFIVIVSAIAAVVGRTAKQVTHSLIPGKEPVTYLVIVWGVATFMLFAFRPDLFAFSFTDDLEFKLSGLAMLCMLFAVSVMYPIGYFFAFIRVQYVMEFDKKSAKPKGAYPIIYYYNKSGDLCISEETLWSTIKAMLGAHCTLDMPLDKIVRKYPISARRRILRAHSPDCVSIFRDPPVAGTKKIGPFTFKVNHHAVYIQDYNTIDYLTFLMRTGAFVDSIEIATNLNSRVAAIEVERTEDHIVSGARTMRDLRQLTMDDELAAEVRASLLQEEETKKEHDLQAMIERLKKIGVNVTVPVDDPPKKEADEHV